MLLAMLALASGCEREPAGVPIAGRTPSPLDTRQTGAIDGTVRFTGTPPEPVVVDVTADPACAAAHAGGFRTREVEVADGRVAQVFVYVARGLEDRVFAMPAEPVVIDQRGCTYAPRVAGVRTGQSIEFVNSDDTLHNVHGMPRASAAWNFGMAFQGTRRKLTIAHPEVMVPIGCNVHPWMRAYLGVVDHPYFAVTDASGAFHLAGVPAGTYVLAAWHERLGTQERTVVVPAEGTVTADFTFTE